MPRENLKDQQLTWLSLQKVLDEIQASLDEEARQQAGPWSNIDAFPPEMVMRRNEGAQAHEGLPAMQFYLTRAGQESCSQAGQLIRDMPEDLFIVC